MRILPLQRILFPVAAFAAVMIYLIWWGTYAGIHFKDRYTLRPPGAAAEVQGTTVRLLSLVRSGKLSDAKGGEPALPDPGAVWVVAQLEIVRHDPAKEFPCGMELLGPDGRRWHESIAGVKRALEWCQLQNPLGQPVQFESIFTVPARYADQLIGIALEDNSTPARTPVIRPL